MSKVNNLTLQEIMFKRRSIRKFKQVEVPNSLLLKILDAARLAPSASNRQPCRFYIITDETTKNSLRQSGGVKQDFALKAPVCIVCCADMEVYSDKGTENAINELVESGAMDNSSLPGYWTWWNNELKNSSMLKLAFLDIGIAVENMVLMATANGLGTCWMRRMDEEQIGKTLQLPPNYAVVTLLVLGYPEEDPSPRPRKELKHFLINPEQVGLG